MARIAAGNGWGSRTEREYPSRSLLRRNGMSVESPPSVLEAALASPRWTSLVLLGVLPLVCWAWIVAMAHDMYGPMTGASRWMMTSTWDLTHVFLLWAMWTVMMIGMMLPSAAALIVVYGAAVRRRGASRASAATYSLALGYVTVWAVFSVGATIVQRLLAEALVLSPMMELTLPKAGGVLLLIAGAYQFTSLKHACLRACQSPLGFLMRGWREGLGGAFRLGTRHGVYCLGCCWALMLLLFAGGVMNLTVIAALTVLVAVEKTGFLGTRGIRVLGLTLAGLGVWVITGV
jgi:predicted metal-binding membrane protein